MEMSKRKKITMWVLGSMLAGIAGCSTLTPYSPGLCQPGRDQAGF